MVPSICKSVPYALKTSIFNSIGRMTFASQAISKTYPSSDSSCKEKSFLQHLPFSIEKHIDRAEVSDLVKNALKIESINAVQGLSLANYEKSPTDPFDRYQSEKRLEKFLKQKYFTKEYVIDPTLRSHLDSLVAGEKIEAINSFLTELEGVSVLVGQLKNMIRNTLIAYKTNSGEFPVFEISEKKLDGNWYVVLPGNRYQFPEKEQIERQLIQSIFSSEIKLIFDYAQPKSANAYMGFFMNWALPIIKVTAEKLSNRELSSQEVIDELDLLVEMGVKRENHLRITAIEVLNLFQHKIVDLAEKRNF